MKNKIFKTVEAKILCSVYESNRQFAKQKFINKLIDYQYFFGTTSIVGSKLLLSCYYQKRTVESVCKDLGYTLISFSNPMQKYYYGGNYGRYTVFTFVEKDSINATED